MHSTIWRPHDALYACRAKISMRLSSKQSEGSGLRKISSIKSGVSSPKGGVVSAFQPTSQTATAPSGPSASSVRLQLHILCHVVAPHTSASNTVKKCHIRCKGCGKAL